MSLHPRVERSRRSFEEAALAAARLDTRKLTVTALCEASGLNRATFYLHYQDLDDLLASTVQRLTDEAADRWRQSVEGVSPLDLPEQSKSAFSDYLHHVDTHRDFYRWALVARGSYQSVMAATGSYLSAVTNGLTVVSGRAAGPHDVGRRSAFFAGAMLGVISQWVSDDDPESVTSIGNWLWERLTVQVSADGGDAHG